MTRRVVIGKRSNGDTGVFVSPSGVDAFTAADSSLTMSISSKVSNLILLGHASGSTTVSLGLSQRPFVILTSEFNFSSIPGHTLGPGPTRPSPANVGSTSSLVINSSGASMTITSSLPVFYFVYSSTF